MIEPEIDRIAMVQALPGAVALLTPQLVYADVNEDWLRLFGRTREQEVGRYMPDDFANSSNHPGVALLREVVASLRRVAESGERETMELQRFDPQDPGRPGRGDERYWSMSNIPLVGPDGRVALLMHRVEEVTELVCAREIALSLQEAMLPAPRPLGRHPVAVRYRPADDALAVGGDWYDLVDLPDERLGVAVGDVVGHGLAAAGVMGQLRSALSAASLATSGPAQALDVLELYALSVSGAENATVVNAFVDWNTHAITYSSAGHPPPALLRSDGTVEFLDQATDPPLGACPQHRPWLQANLPFTEGAFLVLYTDGLIERRREDIDTGLARLADSLARHQKADPETLADVLLADLLPPDDVTDDTALVIVRL
ncbi:SpoIIE family protein phosphatase [Streptomyces sp. NPDC096354]|uniref:SpoIIE family protein phosphatase n=1 Tax=Streptomyces sp. NPDC096354 TaxID=3366088 RepID=UPI0038177A4A